MPQWLSALLAFATGGGLSALVATYRGLRFDAARASFDERAQMWARIAKLEADRDESDARCLAQNDALRHELETTRKQLLEQSAIVHEQAALVADQGTRLSQARAEIDALKRALGASGARKSEPPKRKPRVRAV